MKKIMFILLLLTAPMVFAAYNETVVAKCPDNGKIITGENGQKYCFAGIEMNWYTAFAWCQSLGLQLVTVEQLCDGSTKAWNGLSGYYCFNLLNATHEGPPTYGWTATPALEKENAITVATTGYVYTEQNRVSAQRNAFCR